MQGGKGVTLAPKEGLDSITHTYTQSSRKAGCVHHLIPSFDPGVLKTSHTVDHTLPSEWLLCPAKRGWQPCRGAKSFCRFSCIVTMLPEPGRSALRQNRRIDTLLCSFKYKLWTSGKDVCVERSDEATDPGSPCVQSILTLGTSVYCSVLHI